MNQALKINSDLKDPIISYIYILYIILSDLKAQVLQLHKISQQPYMLQCASIYSAQDGESTDINCLVFQAHCENGKILMKCQVYNKTNFWQFFVK